MHRSSGYSDYIDVQQKLGSPPLPVSYTIMISAPSSRPKPTALPSLRGDEEGSCHRGQLPRCGVLTFIMTERVCDKKGDKKGVGVRSLSFVRYGSASPRAVSYVSEVSFYEVSYVSEVSCYVSEVIRRVVISVMCSVVCVFCYVIFVCYSSVIMFM